jgi:hypothetical protein
MSTQSNRKSLVRAVDESLTMLEKARWLVPEMVKNGLNSSFVYWSLIGACLTGNLDRVERRQITGFHQSRMEVECFHKSSRLHLARLESQGAQEG